MSFGYTVDKKITDVLREKTFTVSAEIVPPRNGENQQVTLQKLQTVIGSGVHFLSVTKGAGGSLRGGTLPMAQSIKDHFGRPCIAHFTCRDLLPEEIENHLIDHHYFGIRNILALRGDPPQGTEEWLPREGGYSYAYQLIEQIRLLNSGQFLTRKEFKVGQRESTDFCIGCAVYPEHPNKDERLSFAKQKFDAGAEYGITQMIFDSEVHETYLNDLAVLGVYKPILPGLRVLKSKKQALVMKSRFGCAVPDWYLKMLPEEGEVFSQQQILEPFLMLIEKLKKIGAPGVHVFVLSDTENCTQAIQTILK